MTKCNIRNEEDNSGKDRDDARVGDGEGDEGEGDNEDEGQDKESEANAKEEGVEEMKQPIKQVNCLRLFTRRCRTTNK